MKSFKSKLINRYEQIKDSISNRVFAMIGKFKDASLKKKLLIILLFSFPAMVIIFGVAAQITSKPNFCRTCHYMEPYYQSWHESKHNNITCTKCHFPPGIAGTVRGKIEGLVQVVNYLTSSYVRRKPWAEISDESCTQKGCHDHRLLDGKVNFKNVVFDHKHHLGKMRRGKRLRCTSCHSQIVQGDHMVVTETTCFLCHFKKGDFVEKELYGKLSNCKTCHRWDFIPKEDLSKFRFNHDGILQHKTNCQQCHKNIIVGDGFVPKENCYSCHFDNERLSKYNNINLLHNVHIYQNKIECIQCHLQIQHKVEKLSYEDDLECSSCHVSEHNEQLTLFTGKSIHGIKGVANPMFEAGLDCSSCHLTHMDLMGKASVMVSNPKACETCHGKGYAKLLNMWEESAYKKLAVYKNSIDGVAGALKRSGTFKQEKVQKYYDIALDNYNVIKNGIPIHNIKYSELLITKGFEQLGTALKNGKASYKLPEFVKKGANPGECYNCHTGIDEITIKFGHQEFSHKTHVFSNALDCKTCHSNTKKHGEVIITQQGCNSCHHQKADNNNCKDCHKYASEIYSGKYEQSDKPGYMASGDIKCPDCHLKDGKVWRPNDKNCATCHDDSYIETAKGWRNDVKKIIADTEKLISAKKSSPGFIYSFRFAKIENNFRNIVKGSANGMHNYEFTLELLDNIKEQINKNDDK